MATNEIKRKAVSFAALDPYLETKIVSPREKVARGRDGLVEWGDGNLYPEYLTELYDNVPTLQSIIDGTVDFIVGDGVEIMQLRGGLAPSAMNLRGDTIEEQLRDVATDLNMYGGFALQVIRGRDGRPAEIYYIDVRRLRTNRDNTVFWWCEDWERRTAHETVRYPVFMPSLDWASLDEEGRSQHASSIVFVKTVRRRVYPVPKFASAVKAGEIERGIDDFHLNSLDNGFTSSQIVNFNNGDTSDEMKEQIEDEFTEKFSGHANAGRILFSWNNSKDTATTIESPKVEDFGDRYRALSERSRQQLFTAFRANPNLFGIPTEGNGFANEQYEESFRLYNRTAVRPMQRLICDAYDRIYGQTGVLTITPFSLDYGMEKEVR